MKEATASLESLAERCLYKKCAYYISLFSLFLFFSRNKMSKKEWKTNEISRDDAEAVAWTRAEEI